EYKGDMEIINRADSNFIELQNPELMTKLRQSMKISLTANGDSLIFSWFKITDIKSYQLALVYESQTVSITPHQGIQNHSFRYPKNKVDDAAKIQSWELTVEAVNGTHYKIEKLFIDAPLSLPGVYRDPGSYDDYFYRKCDREIGAMSPMFLGGLTARAVRLKDYFEGAGLKVFEVWPTKMAESAGILRDSYKKNLADLSSAIGILNGSGYLKNDFSASNWHEFDSVLAYISGLRIVRKSAVSYGDRREGLIYV
ncbi:MAG: hypothetical protein ACP5E3_13725, partial [Bacteroidales bacterium]